MLYSAVPKQVASLLNKLNSFTLPNNFYLAGGTAATLYLGHRISIDIDLFTKEHFLTGPIIESIRKAHLVHLEDVTDKDSLVAEVEGVRLSLFYYPYPLLEPLYYDNTNKISIASLIDIAAMKTVAMVQRGTAKDFVDLKAIMETTSMPLAQLVSLTLKKYGTQHDYAYHIKRALVFFDEAEKGLKDVILLKEFSLQHPISQTEWEDVKRFFIRIAL